MIDFESQETHFLFNPRLPEREKAWLVHAQRAESFPQLPAHIWLASSGTTSADSLKVIALSKRGFLIAAAAANRFLQSTANDVWLNPLPPFHVGGLSIYARAFLSGAKVVVPKEPKWNPRSFVESCREANITLASLVPTQVYDLVNADAGDGRRGFSAPPSLRAVLVGGGALSLELLEKGRSLGWPLLPTYGMTEVCSQIATGYPDAEILGHIEARVGDDGFLQIRGEALFTRMGYVDERGFTELADARTPDGWYKTNDFCEIAMRDHGVGMAKSRVLRFIGRAGDLIKVGGELVNLARLRARLEEFARRSPGNGADADVSEVILSSDDDARLGQRVVAVVKSADARDMALFLEKFNATVAPFERVRAIYGLAELPRTDLGKIKMAEIRKLIAH